MNIGERIQRFRKEREWTQKRLAEKSGVPQAAISKIERGAVKPLFETVVRIARALEVGLDELGGISGGRSKKAPKIEPALLRLLERERPLAVALKNPAIVQLVKKLSPSYLISMDAREKDALVLLMAAAKVLGREMREGSG